MADLATVQVSFLVKLQYEVPEGDEETFRAQDWAADAVLALQDSAAQNMLVTVNDPGIVAVTETVVVEEPTPAPAPESVPEPAPVTEPAPVE